MTCRICQNTATRSFNHLGFNWERCRKCKSILKVLTEEEYLSLNPGYDPGHYYDSDDIAQVRESLEVENKKATLLKHLGARHPEGLKLLDIGCGMGGYLIAAKELGMDVLGIEPSEDHSRVAKNILQLPVINDYFSLSKIQPRKFDLIILSHVIEHILYPEKFVKEILEVLNPDGILVMMTPNAASSYYDLLGRFWSMIRPVDHVSLLSRNSFQAMKLDGIVSMRFKQSEYPWEFAASVASSLLAMKRHFSGVEEVTSVGLGRHFNARVGKKAKAEFFKALLFAASAPFHLLNVLFDKQGCLIVIVQK